MPRNKELWEAADLGDLAKLTQRLDEGAEIDWGNPESYSETSLYRASKEGHLPVVNVLLLRGAQINKRDDGGWTPLFVAALNGRQPVVQALLQAGADPAASPTDGNYAGWTPFHAAASIGRASLAELLLVSGDYVNQARGDGFMPLFAAARDGHTDVVHLLARKGAKINVQNQDGDTPLMIAGWNGHHGAVEVLLEAGADPTIAENDGTAEEQARSRGHEELANFIRDFKPVAKEEPAAPSALTRDGPQGSAATAAKALRAVSEPDLLLHLEGLAKEIASLGEASGNALEALEASLQEAEPKTAEVTSETWDKFEKLLCDAKPLREKAMEAGAERDQLQTALQDARSLLLQALQCPGPHMLEERLVKAETWFGKLEEALKAPELQKFLKEQEAKEGAEIEDLLKKLTKLREEKEGATKAADDVANEVIVSLKTAVAKLEKDHNQESKEQRPLELLGQLASALQKQLVQAKEAAEKELLGAATVLEISAELHAAGQKELSRRQEKVKALKKCLEAIQALDKELAEPEGGDDKPAKQDGKKEVPACS